VGGVCRRSALGTAALTIIAAASLAAPARADDVGDPAAAHALGRVFVAGPAQPSLAVFAAAGYGYTESVLGAGDSHHRAAGALGADGRVLPWLDLALRFDGRYDLHTLPGQASDHGFVGDPRLFARVDGVAGASLRLSARAGLWLPGDNAPSIVWGALTPELVGAASFAPHAAGWSITANAGYRRDRSARSAPNAADLSASDRLALGVSAFDQLLLGVGATVGRGAVQGFAEASAALLMGSGAPPLAQSPMLVGGGARFAIGPRTQLELEVEASPSARPSAAALAPGAALFPILPRVAGWIGLATHFGGERPSPRAPTPLPAVATTAPPPPVDALLSGKVVAADGGKLDDLKIEATRAGRTAAIAADPDGQFTIQGAVGETVSLSAEAAGTKAASETVTLTGGPPVEVVLTLERKLPSGQLRGLVRSFKGAAVAAAIGIVPVDGTTGEAQSVRADKGRFEIDVAPGAYEVTISAPGYATQTRRVQIEQNGVTLLDVDLRVAP
jgi:hypothetical protein